MRSIRRIIVAALTVTVWGMASADRPQAQSYPRKTIRIVLPFAAGGATDYLARLLGNGLNQRLGKPVIIENKPGAGGNLGTEMVSKAAPDGYTLAFVAAGNLVINPFIYRAMPFDSLKDLTPVFNFAEAPQLLIIPASLPPKTLAEFVALARERPGALNYGSAGAGSTTHLAADHFVRLAGLDMVHVPYAGMGAVIADLIAARVQMVSVALQPVRPQIDSQDLRVLAVAAKHRLPALPAVPTSAEAGMPDYLMTTWFGLVAPRDTSQEIVTALNIAAQSVLDDPAVRQKLADAGAEPVGGSAESFAATIRTDYQKWEQVVKASGVRLD